ncbi:cupin domain-containing protein [Nocardioides ungokensis]|uniref:cupin domain-containing protein n=1 Tax=Nocardioides ungokensis TaxID=1643322 RepID=UPI001FE4B68F|nr:cupin domain-containing protein [Nocardioides ungokensis]
MSTEQSIPDQTVPAPVMREPGHGRATWAMGSLFEHLLEPGEGGGELGAALVTQPPGIATPLHRHTREAEAFFVLEGRIDYRAGEQDFELYPGCFMYLPRGLPHAFRIRGDTPARFLGLTTPAGLFHLYDEVGVPAAERGCRARTDSPRRSRSRTGSRRARATDSRSSDHRFPSETLAQSVAAPQPCHRSISIHALTRGLSRLG